MQQQEAANRAPGGTCASLAPQYQQECVNKWILGNLQPAGVIGGCAGVGPASQQACLNTLVNTRMQQTGEPLVLLLIGTISTSSCTAVTHDMLLSESVPSCCC
jgi:hypothetical protein